MPPDWQTVTVVPLSNNGDWRGIKLFRIPKKVYIRVLERRLRLVVQPQIHEEKCCFCPGHGCRSLSSQGYLRVSGSLHNYVLCGLGQGIQECLSEFCGRCFGSITSVDSVPVDHIEQMSFILFFNFIS